MAKRLHTDRQIIEALESCGWSRIQAAEKLGLSRTIVRKHAERLRRKGFDVKPSIYNVDRAEYIASQVENRPFEISAPPDDDIPIEQLVEHRKRQFSHKKASEESAKLIPVRVKIQGPIGIVHFGDPHVDDDGTDIGALEEHARIVRDTPGMMAVNVGDTTNNWTGRLARLYGEQSTSAKQAWALAEWFLSLCDWLYIIGGNHDLWSGDGNPIRWIAKQAQQLYRSSECRIALNFPNGRSIRVNARHDHAGSSIWNPAHGPMKAAMLGTRDHIYVAGHRHESAYSVLKDPSEGITMHALKVASYKVYDRFAKEKGFRDMALGPCAVTVINPELPPAHPDLIKVFWDPAHGADYLKFLRRD